MLHRIPSASKQFMSLFVIIALSVTTLSLFGSSLPASYPVTSLSQDEATSAITVLNSRLATTAKDHAALAERGWLYLALEEKGKAADDFKHTLSSKSDSLRIAAYVGLAWCKFIPGKRHAVSMGYIRKALAVDSHSAEALYAKTMMMLGGEPTTDDVRVAKRALFKILETDFGYRDAYRVWREVVLDRTDAEIAQVAGQLSTYLATHPDSAAWRMELAWDRYLVDSPEAAQAELDLLKQNNPDFSHPEQLLLAARVKLETLDTLAFQSLYWQAVYKAEQTGDYEMLLRDASTIFTPGMMPRYEEALENGEQKKFLHFFWANLDPVKINPINVRLAEHYFRLAYAQRNYRLQQPHNRFNKSENANRLMGFQGGGGKHHSEKISFSSGYLAGLDHRGLLFMRYGPPDNAKSHHLYNRSKVAHVLNNKLQTRKPPKSLNIPPEPEGDEPPVEELFRDKMSNPLDIWYYDNLAFIFEKLPMTGEFISRPLQVSGINVFGQPNSNEPSPTFPRTGDMQKAMTKQRCKIPHVSESMEYYVAQFATPDMNGIEIEIYQDETLPDEVTPTIAKAASYDTVWVEQERKESSIFKIPGEKDNRWVAVHSLSYPPGEAKFAINFTAGEDSWNGRGALDMEPFDTTFLELSAIVLGLDPPNEASPAHERQGIRFIPRPSFRFKSGEVIRVYLEFYNLANGPERKRSYREYVDVIRYEGGNGILGRISGTLVGMLTFGGEKQGAEIRHKFDREAPPGNGPVAESFLLDTSELIPGTYRLLIEARDNVNVFWDEAAVMFEVYD